MPILSRSVSLMRYRVKGEVEGSFWDVVNEGVLRGAFKPIESSGDDIGFGWTSVDDFMDVEFRGSPYVRANYIALSLRIDAIRVPARVLEMEFKRESRKLMDEMGVRRLGSRRRKELRDNLREALRQRVFPSIQTYDFIWDTTRSVLYFSALSVKARERLEDHFKKCFGLSLVPLLSYLRAQELLTTEKDKVALDELTPCSMIP